MNIKVMARKAPLNRVSRIPVPSVTIWQSIFPCISYPHSIWDIHETGKRFRPGNAGLLSMKDIPLHRAQQGCPVNPTAFLKSRQ